MPSGVFGIQWGELAAMTTVCAFGGGVVYVLLLSKFVTPATLEKHCETVHSVLLTKTVTPESLKVNCEAQQSACRPLMCNKIDQIKAEIKVMDNKREEARKEISEQLQQIHTFVGKVDQFMQERMK